MAGSFVWTAVLLATLGAQAAPDAPPCATITVPEVRAAIEFLACDALEGRDSGFRGAEIAARYIASRFEGAGLEPLGADWLCPFELPASAVSSSVTIAFGATSESDPRRISAYSFSGSGVVNGPSVTGGTGPVKDRVVVLPGGDDPGTSREIATDLAMRGAAAVVFVTNRAGFPRGRGDFRRRKDPRPPGEAEGDDATGADEGDADGPGHGGGALFGIAADTEMLRMPVLRVGRDVGERLVNAAENAVPVSVRVERSGSRTAWNVVAVLRGSDPALAGEYVVLGAHYDHVGTDGHGRIWNGADDNASGTSAMLAVARAIACAPQRPRRSIVFAAWSAEERGLLGSNAFMAAETLAPESIAAYVNLDMVGRNDPAAIEVGQASSDLFERCTVLAREHGMTVSEADPVYLSASDTLAFVGAEVPTVFFFSGMHAEYHTPADSADLIDADKAARVARTTRDLIVEVANDDARPGFIEPRRARQNGGGRRLGVMLDTGYSGRGVRIQSVAPESPAAQAGLKVGDVLLRVGEHAITSQMDLRRALLAQEPGTPFTLDVERGDGDPKEALILTATFEKKERPR